MQRSRITRSRIEAYRPFTEVGLRAPRNQPEKSVMSSATLGSLVVGALFVLTALP